MKSPTPPYMELLEMQEKIDELLLEEVSEERQQLFITLKEMVRTKIREQESLLAYMGQTNR